MPKKCAPGTICIENVTLFMFFVLVAGLAIMYYVLNNKMQSFFESSKNTGHYSHQIGMHPTTQLAPTLLPIATRNNEMADILSPPFKDSVYYRRDSTDIRGTPPIVPIQVKTQGYSGGNYSQVGILTRTNKSDMILPLFGKINISNRSKWNYYTLSNTGNINTKLPVSLKGRSCTSDIGCDEIYNGDVVYVEGYKDTFAATIYENGGMSYIPVI